MPMNSRVRSLLLAVTLLGSLILAAPAALAVGPCAPGAVYDPACDVDENGVINILDIQLIASRFNQSGQFTSDGWLLTGNAGTTPGVNFVGTTDNQGLQLSVNNSRALEIQPTAASPNLTWGFPGNAVVSNAVGGVIGGGGGPSAQAANYAYDDFGVVGGGAFNHAGSGNGVPSDAIRAAVGGGFTNNAYAQGSHVAGGEQNNATGSQSTIGGGTQNTATGERATVAGGYGNNVNNRQASVGGGALHFATGDGSRIGGGSENSAGGDNGVVAGGTANEASFLGSSIGGGAGNWAYTGQYSTVPGGSENRATGPYSLAVGQYARALHAGAFVWADSTVGEFTSSNPNTWRVRATGGSDFNANNSSFSLSSNNSGNGEGFETLSATSNGNNWAALFASNSGTSAGLYANSGGTYAGYFADQIFVTGGCTGCTLMAVALNAGEQALQPGDLVAATGVDSPLAGMTDPVIRVAPANGDSVLGVVYAVLTVSTGQRVGEETAGVQAGDGPARPGDHLLVVVQGMAQVRVSDATGVVPGQKLTVVGDSGGARALRDVEPHGFNTPVLGIALDAPDPATGLAPVLITASAH